MAFLFIKLLVFYLTNKLIYASLILALFILIIFLWYKYYQTEIKLHEPRQSSLMLDTFLLVFGAIFGAVFSDVFLKPLRELSNSGDYLKSFLAIILGIMIYIVAFSLVLYVRIAYGIAVMEKRTTPSSSYR